MDGINGTFTMTGMRSEMTTEALELIYRVMNELTASRPLIKVWQGDGMLSLGAKTPCLRESKYVDADMVYIVAGIGVVAGNKAYPVLKRMDLQLEWVKTAEEASNNLCYQ